MGRSLVAKWYYKFMSDRDNSKSIPEVYDFILTQQHAVVATIDTEGKPRSAVLEFAAQLDMTIYLGVFTDSLLYQRLMDSPHAALVIGGDKGIVVQISVMASELTGADLDFAKETLQRKYGEWPPKHHGSVELAYFACRPTWIRYSDLNQTPWYIEEFDVEAE